LLHARIAAVLEKQFPETMTAEPERLAQHCSEAGRLVDAIAYWHKAGQKAVQRSANQEAVGHLGKALDLIRTLPDTPERAANELVLQRLLGAALMATRGYAAPETGAAFSRARELARTVVDSEDTYAVLNGVWVFEHNRASHAAAREVAEEMLFGVQF
jgi:predicted ATPase